ASTSTGTSSIEATTSRNWSGGCRLPVPRCLEQRSTGNGQQATNHESQLRRVGPQEVAGFRLPVAGSPLPGTTGSWQRATGNRQRIMSRKLTYDSYLFTAAMLIIVVGLVMIYSASAMIVAQKVGDEPPYYFLTRQCVFLLAGGALMLGLMHLDPALLRDRRIIVGLMALVFAGLIAALFQPAINGKHRWIILPFHF